MKDMGIVGRKRAGFSADLPALLLLLPIFFAVFFGRFPVVSGHGDGLNYTKYRPVSSLRLERINRHLDKINKPAVLTIQVYIYTHLI